MPTPPEDQNQPVELTDELPTDLAALSEQELNAAEEAAHAEAAELREIGADELTDEQADRLVALADYIESVAADRTRRTAEQEERARTAEEAAARIDATQSQPEEGDGEGDGEDGSGDGDGEEGDGEGEDAPQAVAAAGRRTPPRAFPGRAPARQQKPAEDKPVRHLSIVAAADIGGGIGAGTELADRGALAAAFGARLRSFPQGEARSPHVRHQLPVATIERRFDADPDYLYTDNPNLDVDSVQELFTRAASERRLAGGSLAAAGGWCAPSENRYTLAAPETLAGIIDLPEVGITRGGLNYTPGPDFSDIYTGAGFSQTEAEAIAGTEKPCVEVDCPDFQEVRLDAVGMCVKAPLLTRAGYPELINRWINGTDVANQHKIAARLITAMRTALGTAVAPTLTGTPVTWSTLTMVELLIEHQRQIRRLSDTETLEVVAPRWLRAAIRSDLANRVGAGVDSVTNAQIAQHFADRGAAVQWVLNYLELGSSNPTIFPSSAELMIYPAGTFVRGNAAVVNLDTIYDTADLQTNVYTAAFVEDGVLLAKMGHGGVRVTVPVHVTGQVGATDLDQNFGTAQVNADG